MSQMIEINLNPDERILRQFGWIALFGFSFVAILAWQEWMIFAGGLGEARETVAACFIGLGVLSAFFSLIFPRANKPIYIILTLLSYPVGFVLSYVIMGLLFFGMITPVAIFFKIIGRDKLDRKFEPEATSYWVDAQGERSKDSYFNQF